jgi:hypothetical protein
MKEAAPWVVVGLVAMAVLFLMTPPSESLPVLAPDFSVEAAKRRGGDVVGAAWQADHPRFLGELVPTVHKDVALAR